MTEENIKPSQDGDIIIECVDVHKSFEDNHVHRGVYLKIRRGETMTIIGASGEGKTVLVKQMIGLMKPTKGTIYIEGENIVPLSEKGLLHIRKDVGYLFQGAALFDSLTVADNIAYGLREHFKMDEDKIQAKVKLSLERVGLRDSKVPTLSPSELSGGMQKRVGLARAIATDPKIIIYDEPTTGLDPTNIRRINKLIRHLQKEIGVTSVAITHDMKSTFEFTDRIAMLWEGKIIQVGTIEEMQNSETDVVRQFIEGSLPMDNI